MDRIALAKRLESLSSVFASHTPYNRDLKAMSYVLTKMAEDKFSGILSPDFPADGNAKEEVESCLGLRKGPGVPPMDGVPGGGAKVIVIKEPVTEQETGIMSVEANEKTAGMFWCREASKAVVDNLLRDVVGMNKSICCDTGRHLDKEQIPDGTHAGLPDRGVALKPEQTPDVAASIDSGMYEKSKKAPVVKEASIEDIKKKKDEDAKKKAIKVLEKKEKDASDESGEKKEQAAEKKEDDAKDLVDEASKKLEEAKEEEKKAEKEEGEKDAAKKEPVSSIIEGIELTASMDEFELDANEAAELSKLFQ
jgi:hypothetical protein